MINGIVDLIGRQLSSVEFVQDYVQLKFDGPILTVNARMFVQTEAGEFGWQDHCYHDMLCKPIAKILRLTERSEEELRLFFDAGYTLRISLRDEHQVSPEAAVLSDDGKVVDIW